MSDCILCSGDLLLHIHKDQLYWYCDRCRERFPLELTTRYSRFSIRKPKPLSVQRSLNISKHPKPQVIRKSLLTMK